MPFLLLAASLTFLCPALEPPPKHEAHQEEAARPEEAKAAKPKRKLAAPTVPEEQEPPVKAKAKVPTARPAAVTPAHPVAVTSARPAAVTLAHPVPVTSARPVTARPLSESDARAARLEAENARLRQQLSENQRRTPETVASPEAALAELQAGNGRFVEGARVRTQLSMQDPALREALAKGQAPFAVIITCSDSRLADNLIFDQELGRLFTIREAGNSPDTQSLASVEYALEHLGSKVVVVMGHSHCGAVQAVSDAHGVPLPGNLWSLQAAMSGLLESTPDDPNETSAEHMDHLIRHNAQRQAQAVLDRSESVRTLVAQGKVKVVAAVYDLATGRVAFETPAAPHAAAPAHH